MAMLIVLAYPYDGYEPDDTISVDDKIAARLVNGGSARYADGNAVPSAARANFEGATATGAPTTGTYQAGDFVTTEDGHVWVCTVSGSPGTWVDAGGNGGLDGWNVEVLTSAEYEALGSEAENTLYITTD